MKARFTDEQIISIIKEQDAGEKTADVCRRHGISSATFYKYKSKYGGMRCTAGYRAAMSREWSRLTRSGFVRLRMRTAS